MTLPARRARRCSGDARHLADRPDPRVGGAAPLVDDDAAARADLQPGGAGQLVARPDAGGEHDDVDVQLVEPRGRPVGRDHPVHPAVAARGELRRRRPGVHADAQRADQPLQRLAATLVDLQRHQPRRELDDVGLHAQRGQRAGRLEPQQAAADDGAHDRARPRPAAARAPASVTHCRRAGDVVDRAVDEAARQVLALDRRHERRRAGGQTSASYGYARPPRW
jgi:hypothetical protein